MVKAEIIFTALAALLFAIILLVARQWSFATGLFPMVIGICGLALAVVALAGDILKLRRGSVAVAETPLVSEPDPEAQTPVKLTMGWIAIFFAAVFLIGFQWGLTAAILAFYLFEARLNITASVIAAVLSGGFIYLAENVLNMSLYGGLILELF